MLKAFAMALVMVCVYGSEISLNTDGQWYQFCSEYAAPRFCNTCFASFRLNSGECVKPARTIPNCIMYGIDGSCTVCVYGYKFYAGTCVRTEPQDLCLLYSNNNSCLMCARGVAYVNGNCNSGLTCTGSACSFCSNNSGVESCTRCKKNFTLYKPAGSAPVCVPATGALKNCWTTINKTDCFSCNINYYLINGMCAQSPRYYFDIDWIDRLTKKSLLQVSKA